MAAAKTKKKTATRAKSPKQVSPKKAPRKTQGKIPWTKGVSRPELCKSLPEVRAAIDAMDDLLLPMLAHRLKLVASAARFKPSVAGVVVQARVEEIIIRVRKAAVRFGVNPDCFEDTYRHLIDAYTREEQRNWPKLHKKK